MSSSPGEGLHDVCFATRSFRGTFASPVVPQDDTTPHSTPDASMMGESWSFFNHIGGGQQPPAAVPHTVRNPNKAIVTVNAKTSEILVANEMACELFAFSREELLGLQLSDLVTLKSKGSTTVTETHIGDGGELIEVSGKVVSISQVIILPILLSCAQVWSLFH